MDPGQPMVILRRLKLIAHNLNRFLILTIVLMFTFFGIACGPKKVKRDYYEVELEKLERLSLNLDSLDENPMLRGAVLSVIMFNSHQIEKCYQKASANKPNLVGKIKTFFTVHPNGKMLSFTIKENTLHSPQVETCVERVFRTMDFPPNDKIMDVTHTIKFSKADEDPRPIPTL